MMNGETWEEKGCRFRAVVALLTLIALVAIGAGIERCQREDALKSAGVFTPTAMSKEIGEAPTPTPTPLMVPMALVVTGTVPIPVSAPTCLAAPLLTDPFDGKPTSATGMLLAWKTDSGLKPGELFDVLVSPNANDLTNVLDSTNPRARIAMTTENNLAIDLTKWKYAGMFDRFHWLVKIIGSDGKYWDCAGQPAAFVLLPPVAPSTATPTLVPCVAAPVLFDPPDGRNFSAKNTVLRWRSDYELKPDEVFGILVWPEGNNEPTKIATTREKTFPIDLRRWNYAGWFCKFFWGIRIERTDGMVRSCASQPFAFVLTAPGEPAQPQQQQQPPPPKPPVPSIRGAR